MPTIIIDAANTYAVRLLKDTLGDNWLIASGVLNWTWVDMTPVCHATMCAY